MNTPAADQGKYVIGLLVGFLASCFIINVIAIPVGWALGRRATMSDPNRGWRLMPAIVFYNDQQAGTLVTFDMISQRSVPTKFVDASIILPNDATKLVNQRLVSAVKAGDFARWPDLAPKGVEHCFE